MFITGLCNAKCFYCPASQDKDETPQTQRLLFADPERYAQYVNHFKFSAVSFSGGEPLMVLDRTLRAIETIRRRCSPDVYIWMYTNGILGNEAKFRQLAAAGLDEIRFDLGATDYHLNVLRSAADCVRNVTVEIPAVPEEVERLKHLLPRLCELGVPRLNLHQLRLTAYNAEKLLQHEYTYLHGEQATVLESEEFRHDPIAIEPRERRARSGRVLRPKWQSPSTLQAKRTLAPSCRSCAARRPPSSGAGCRPITLPRIRQNSNMSARPRSSGRPIHTT